jgi:hypothetical protein
VSDLAALAAKIERVADDMTGQTSRAQMARIGAKLQPEIDRAVSADIGDTSMSGWRRGSPIAIVGSHRVLSDHAVVVQPVGQAKGPMAVLERGRNIGNSGGMAGPGVSADGSTRRNKNGSLRKVRARKAKRWNGYTQGKGTMGDASRVIADKAPDLIAGELRKALRKHLRGG